MAIFNSYVKLPEGIPPCSIPHDFPHEFHIFQSEIREATSRSRPEPNFTKASII